MLLFITITITIIIILILLLLLLMIIIIIIMIIFIFIRSTVSLSTAPSSSLDFGLLYWIVSNSFDRDYDGVLLLLLFIIFSNDKRWSSCDLWYGRRLDYSIINNYINMSMIIATTVLWRMFYMHFPLSQQLTWRRCIKISITWLLL